MFARQALLVLKHRFQSLTYFGFDVELIDIWRGNRVRLTLQDLNRRVKVALLDLSKLFHDHQSVISRFKYVLSCAAMALFNQVVADFKV